MQKVLIDHDELWPFYFIVKNTNDSERKVEVSDEFMKDYNFVMGQFRLLQKNLRELVGDKE